MKGSSWRAALVAVLGFTAACTAPSAPLKVSSPSAGGATVPSGPTCPVMTKVEYDHSRSIVMLGPSPDNPLICLQKRAVGGPRALVLNWYAVDRLRSSDVDRAVEVLVSIVTGPIGFVTDWNRFLGNNSAPYETRFTVMPDQSIAVGAERFDVRVVTAKSAAEDNEYWIAKDRLLILKYVNRLNQSANYTVTGLARDAGP